jgi:hypothetical protein
MYRVLFGLALFLALPCQTALAISGGTRCGDPVLAVVYSDPNGIQIQNIETYEWKDVRVVLNSPEISYATNDIPLLDCGLFDPLLDALHDMFASNYTYTVAELASYEKRYIPFSEFTLSDGTRFDPVRIKLIRVVIICKIPNGTGVGLWQGNVGRRPDNE